MTAINIKSLLAVLTVFRINGSPVLAAECGAYGLCGISPASTRNQLYAARQHVCGDTNLYQSDGCYCAPSGGQLCWPGGNSQQICWDAFENILNQCRPEGSGLGYHDGRWIWNGRQYWIHSCSCRAKSYEEFVALMGLE